MAIKEKTLGPEHPDVASSLNNLAGLFESQVINLFVRFILETCLKSPVGGRAGHVGRIRVFSRACNHAQ